MVSLNHKQYASDTKRVLVHLFVHLIYQLLLSVLNCDLAQITVVLLYHVWVSLFRICDIEDNVEISIKQFHPGSDQWGIFLKSV